MSQLSGVTYANGIAVSETTAERYFKAGPCDLREAFRAGAGSEARHHQEEVPPSLRAMVNRIRTLAVRPDARWRTSEAILAQVLAEFEDRSLAAWSA